MAITFYEVILLFTKNFYEKFLQKLILPLYILLQIIQLLSENIFNSTSLCADKKSDRLK